MISTYERDKKVQRFIILFFYTFIIMYFSFLIGGSHGRKIQKERDRTYSSEIMYDKMNERNKGIQECIDALNIWSQGYESKDPE